MPFVKWAVEPVFLCHQGKSADFTTVTNAAFANCLRQLASLAGIADRVFEEIGADCRLLAERTERLSAKIVSCQEAVARLNARAVPVPVSDLSQVAKLLRREKPYATRYEQSSQLFLPSTRPPCVDKLYGTACTTPVAIMCAIDRYRTDGLSSSELFMVTPVLGGTRKKARRLLDIETRKPANFTLAKSKQDSTESGLPSICPLVSPSIGYILKQNENLELERLPSPEEQAMLVSLEYPSTVVPVDTSGTGFNKMSLLRRSLIHADFVIKRKKSKKKSKRRHTFCEGQNGELEKAIRNVTNSSCQTDDMLDVTSISSSATVRRSLSKRRSRSTLDTSWRKTILDELDLEFLKQESKDLAAEDDKEKSNKANTISPKKTKAAASLRSRASSFNPISSLSAAISIAAVKMRNSTRNAANKQDDGRSSSGNWSASSSTRASVDSDHQHAISPVDGVSSPSRNSAGKDSLLSDATQNDLHNRSKDEILVIQSLTKSPVKRKKYASVNLNWNSDSANSRVSSTPTPEFTSLCSSTPTPVVRSPYAGRRGVSDDGDSSVYSVDTDGYYTSMHTDSGLWCNAANNMKLDDVSSETVSFRQRQESQSSVSTIGNSSINSFLSKSATECSSNSGSLKQQCPEPPPRISSCRTTSDSNHPTLRKEQELDDSDKSYSPHPQNGSASESDHEVGDRIRVKTAITANRYPSMCAVSPETSDDEISELKNKTSAPHVNVIVAEVHREEKAHYGGEETNNELPKRDEKTDNENKIGENSSQTLKFPSLINMYRSETPVPSNFSFSVQANQYVTTSTPKSGANITTFSPDLSEIHTVNDKTENLETHKSNHDSEKSFCNRNEIIITEKPISSHIGSEKSLIPLKYAQRITVTPIARSDSTNSCTGTIKRTPRHYASTNSYSSNSAVAEKQLPVTNNKSTASSYISFKAPDSPVSNFVRARSGENIPSSPKSSLPRSVARVVLDPSGKVVYSSNSLERASSTNANRADIDKRNYATLPMYQAHSDRSKTIVRDLQNSPDVSLNAVNQTIKSQSSDCQTLPSKYPVSHSTHLQPVYQQNTSNQTLSSYKLNRDFNFRPSRGGRFCRSYFPTHLISMPSETRDKNEPSVSTTYSPKAQSHTLLPCSSPLSGYSAGQNSGTCSQIPSFPKKLTYWNDSLSYSTDSTNPVPNQNSTFSVKQYVPSSTADVWPNRIHLSSSNKNYSYRNEEPIHNMAPAHNKAVENTFPTQNTVTKTEMHSSPTFLRPDLIPSGESPPSTLDITSPAKAVPNVTSLYNQSNSDFNGNLASKNQKSNNELKNLKSMSATELFAIIHSSKKKHNIKTESEKSMSPMSSRSVSPALSHSPLPKLQPIETGVLSKRPETSLNFSDRSKWCNSMPSNTAKKQIVQDKIGPTKPTSMHDFKMLLLQTRTGSYDSNPRPSAAELLKVSPPKVTTASHISSNSSKVFASSPSSKTPVSYFNSPLHYSPGHGTVPIKRNFRTRSPYLTRYDSAYPPIMEDCSEEIESNYEDSKCLISNPKLSKGTMYQQISESVPSPTVKTKPTSTWV